MKRCAATGTRPRLTSFASSSPRPPTPPPPRRSALLARRNSWKNSKANRQERKVADEPVSRILSPSSPEGPERGATIPLGDLPGSHYPSPLRALGGAGGGAPPPLSG